MGIGIGIGGFGDFRGLLSVRMEDISASRSWSMEVAGSVGEFMVAAVCLFTESRGTIRSGSDRLIGAVFFRPI
jgi:hypothetical protein